MKTVYLNASYFPAVELLSAIGTAAILLFGGYQVIDGQIMLGVLVAFVGYLQTFFDPIQQISQLYTTYQQGMAALDKIFDLLDTEADVVDGPNPIDPGEIKGGIDLEGVWFGYAENPGREMDWALTDIDLRILPGQTVALVGETGAGKSTLAKLIARFYDPQRGRILIDGIDVRELDSNALRSRLGIVPQEGFLFSGHDRRQRRVRPPRCRPGGHPRGPAHGRRSAADRRPRRGRRHRGRRARGIAVGRASARSSPSPGRCWPSRGS